MSAVQELRRLVRPPEGVEPVDWEDVEARLGYVLPSDYKDLVDL